MSVLVSNELRNARLAVCAACPERKTINGGVAVPVRIDYCKSCGCPLATKAWAVGTDCPLGKWPKPEARPVG